MICLSKAPPDAPNEAQQLGGEAAVNAILNQVYRRDMLRLAGGEAMALKEAKALVAAAPIYQLSVARSLDGNSRMPWRKWNGSLAVSDGFCFTQARSTGGARDVRPACSWRARGPKRSRGACREGR